MKQYSISDNFFDITMVGEGGLLLLGDIKEEEETAKQEILELILDLEEWDIYSMLIDCLEIGFTLCKLFK